MSLQNVSRELNIEIIVIDNASFDGAERMIAMEFKEVRYIQSLDNLGFSRANNIAFRASTGNVILFLNPDTVVDVNSITRMVAAVHGQNNSGVVGARLLNGDGSIQTSCIQAFPTITNQLLDSNALRQRTPAWTLWGTRAILESDTQPREVEVISGACMMIKREVLERINLFSEDYFMYCEDTDLCLKAIKYGYVNYYCGDAVVTHYGGGSTGNGGKSGFSSILSKQSLKTYFILHRGRVYGAVYQCAMGIAAVIRLAILGGLLSFTLNGRRRYNAKTAAGKWISILRWSLGLEPWSSALPLHEAERACAGRSDNGAHR